MTPERLAELETKAKHPEWRFAAPKATILDLIAHIRDLEAQVRETREVLVKAAEVVYHDTNHGEAEDAIRAYFDAYPRLATATPSSPEVGA